MMQEAFSNRSTLLVSFAVAFEHRDRWASFLNAKMVSGELSREYYYATRLSDIPSNSGMVKAAVLLPESKRPSYISVLTKLEGEFPHG